MECMLEALAERFRRQPSEYDLNLALIRGALRVVRRNVIDDFMSRLKEKDPSVVLIEHLAPRDPVFPTNNPSAIWAIHFDLKPVEGIEQAKQMSWRERRRIPTCWTSRAVGIGADRSGVNDVRYTSVEDGSGRWKDLGFNLEYLQWCINRGVKPSEISYDLALSYALSLATPLGDFRYGTGLRSLDKKPRDSKYWKALV